MSTHNVPDLSNLGDHVPTEVRTSLQVVAAFVAAQGGPGRDPKTAASRLAQLVNDLNILAVPLAMPRPPATKRPPNLHWPS